MMKGWLVGWRWTWPRPRDDMGVGTGRYGYGMRKGGMERGKEGRQEGRKVWKNEQHVKHERKPSKWE